MKKGTLSTIFLILVFFAGLSLLLYPTVSDYWNSLHSTQVVSEYAEQVAQLDNNIYEELILQAQQYNMTLLEKNNPYIMTPENTDQYESLLNVGGNGVMGYIEIPVIDVSAPIYHTTSDDVLAVAIGHVEWTSLPVGGLGTHTVLSGHRGLPSAKLFTDLDQLVLGDTFMLHVLDETLTYQVDQILIVEPDDIKTLTFDLGQDYCTLVTCTPYGINTHRILVRAHRVENAEVAKTVRVTADAMQIEPIVMAPLVAAPMLLILLILLMVSTRRRK